MQGHGTTPQTPGSRTPNSAGTLESAITYLRTSLRTARENQTLDEDETAGFQWRTLLDWTRKSGLILPETCTPAKLGGQEHDLLYIEGHSSLSEDVWYKFTKRNRAGYAVDLSTGKPIFLPAEPIQYLERWKLHNRLFDDTVDLVGIWENSKDLSLVISQKDIPGDDPTWEDLHSYLTNELQFKRLKLPEPLGYRDSESYIKNRFALFDVRPPNSIQTKNGLILPIDFIPQCLTKKQSILLSQYLP